MKLIWVDGVIGIRIWRTGIGFFYKFAGIGVIAILRAHRGFQIRLWRFVFAWLLCEVPEKKIYIAFPKSWVIGKQYQLD